jgi:hypothetical protein
MRRAGLPANGKGLTAARERRRRFVIKAILVIILLSVVDGLFYWLPRFIKSSP